MLGTIISGIKAPCFPQGATDAVCPGPATVPWGPAQQKAQPGCRGPRPPAASALCWPLLSSTWRLWAGREAQKSGLPWRLQRPQGRARELGAGVSHPATTRPPPGLRSEAGLATGAGAVTRGLSSCPAHIKGGWVGRALPRGPYPPETSRLAQEGVSPPLLGCPVVTVPSSKTRLEQAFETCGSSE